MDLSACLLPLICLIHIFSPTFCSLTSSSASALLSWPAQRRGLSAGREWQELWCQDSASVCVCVIWVLSQNFYLASGFPSSFQPLWTSCNKQAHWQKWRKLKREEWGNRYNRRLKVWEEKEVRQLIMFYCTESESENASRLKVLLWSERWQILDGWVNGQMNID